MQIHWTSPSHETSIEHSILLLEVKPCMLLENNPSSSQGICNKPSYVILYPIILGAYPCLRLVEMHIVGLWVTHAVDSCYDIAYSIITKQL